MQKRFSILAISLLAGMLCTLSIVAEQVPTQPELAVTENGVRVLLYPDGTWEKDLDPTDDDESVLDGETPFPLSLQSFDVTARSSNPSQQRYSDDAILHLELKNETERYIQGYRLDVDLYNAFGDLMQSVQLTSGSASIGPGETYESAFVFENNQFINDQVYNSLTAYSIENLRLEFEDVRVIYRD